jgi:adenosylcobinamide kinase/adenosylcobinamide-phosphate guanylyltransferase
VVKPQSGRLRTLVLGGARSGKSAYAEQCLNATGKEVVYIATGQGNDPEMALRIQHHQQRRPSNWRLIEEPLALGQSLLTWCTPGRVVLIDCLTLWLTNLLFSDGENYPEIGVIALPEQFHLQRREFLSALEQVQGELFIVSNEVGLGIVPYGAISRCFTDEAGRLNQEVAQRCERVVFVAAGLPLVLKGSPC